MRPAPDYDWVSNVMSFGSDQFYRRDALKKAGLRPEMSLLDVASGTGLMIKAALELGVEPARVTGVDPSPRHAGGEPAALSGHPAGGHRRGAALW